MVNFFFTKLTVKKLPKNKNKPTNQPERDTHIWEKKNVKRTHRRCRSVLAKSSREKT